MALTPGRMVLDLIRLVDEPLPTSILSTAGESLGIASGTTRVALTRLVRDGKVTRDDRGRYRLASSLDPLTHFINSWREGDRRIRSWKNDWMCVWHPRGTQRTERSRSLRSLDRLGFRESLTGVWVRPNNLAKPLSATRERLHDFGLVDEAQVFIGSDFEDPAEWANLWPLDELELAYRRSLRNVRRSGARLERLSVSRAAVESYHVGDEAMHILAFDPLLPDEILSGDTRRELTVEALKYLELASAAWGQLLAAASRAA